MKEVKEKRNKKVELKLNPTYVSLLNEIAHTYGIKNVNTLVDLILNGKALARSQYAREAKKLMNNIATQASQSIEIVKQVINNAEKKKIPEAITELEEVEKGFQNLKKVKTVDVLATFQESVSGLAKSIGSIIKTNVRYEADTSKEADRFKKRLSEIDVNERLPRKRNYYSRHTSSVYAKNFKNNGVFQAGKRPDAYNRRALKHALHSKVEFMIEHVNPEQYKRADALLTQWNDLNKTINTSLLEGESTGIKDLFKEIVSINRKANQV
ncbi:hypothetical protein [Pseudomonas syringae group genomosp. 3]|uniref:Uncharacterized protein n=1 Tax=Pseudomonas syringae pv. coriandricola TaxID=264453 RepID=A0A3M3JJC9_9PSED|nr:hypothetical protein [Pseudomonas syringae group genomosp. 3]RMN10873.1 hypothetical protein ALQ65_01004 [Pseudomonas syringae pv. coriandricola]